MPCPAHPEVLRTKARRKLDLGPLALPVRGKVYVIVMPAKHGSVLRSMGGATLCCSCAAKTSRAHDGCISIMAMELYISECAPSSRPES